MEVVDLGTRFTVGVDRESRESKVSVIEGLVDLHLGSRGTDRTIRPLEAGHEAHIDPHGKIVDFMDGSRLRSPIQLVGHWPLDEVMPGGVTPERAGHHLQGDPISGEQPSEVPGMSGKALRFEGGGRVDLGRHLPNLTRLEAFTLSAWVRNPDERRGILFSLAGESEEHRIQLYLRRRFISYGWQDGLHYDSVTGGVGAWEDDRWYHVAATFSEGHVRLYRDAQLAASGSVGSLIGTPVISPMQVEGASSASIGWLPDGRQGVESAPQWFEGEIDDVQLYSGALDQAALQFLFSHPGETWKPTNAQPE